MIRGSAVPTTVMLSDDRNSTASTPPNAAILSRCVASAIWVAPSVRPRLGQSGESVRQVGRPLGGEVGPGVRRPFARSAARSVERSGQASASAWASTVRASNVAVRPDSVKVSSTWRRSWSPVRRPTQPRSTSRCTARVTLGGGRFSASATRPGRRSPRSRAARTNISRSDSAWLSRNASSITRSTLRSRRSRLRASSRNALCRAVISIRNYLPWNDSSGRRPFDGSPRISPTDRARSPSAPARRASARPASRWRARGRSRPSSR